MSRRRRYNPDFSRYLLIAVALLVLGWWFLPGPDYTENAPAPSPIESLSPTPKLTPMVKEDVAPPRLFNLPPAPKVKKEPQKQGPQGPRIVVIIDDLGQDRRRTAEVIALPGPLTLAFLPYPSQLQPQVDTARRAGHEVLVHMPMEPEESDLDTGDYVLRMDMNAPEFESVLTKNMASFTGYVGINNHMGSRLTADDTAMRMVMAHLRDRGLLFVDSRTSPASIAARTAADRGVPYAVRDVFLDNDPSPQAVMTVLMSVEALAKQKGLAVAIGHPRDGTIAALKDWLPTLKEKGFVLAPVSAVVTR